MVEDDVISWNIVIGALAQHGCGEDAFQCLTKKGMAGVRPNEVIFVGVLTGFVVVMQALWMIIGRSKALPTVESLSLFMALSRMSACVVI